MRLAFLISLTAAFLLQPAFVQAQPRAKLKVSQVRVGFPAGSQGEADVEQMPLYKAGAWTPIAIDIMVGPPGLKGNEGRIDVVVETVDIDDVTTSYTVTESLPELGPGGTFTVAAYTKPANPNSEITITLRHDNQTLGQPFKQSYVGKDAAQALYLTIGSRMPGLRQAFRGENENQGNWISSENAAYVDRIHQLPDRWFGYDGLDLIVLATSKRNDFLLDFASPRQVRRREAVTDWVQRGGHLIVSAGKNQDMIAQMPEIADLLPVKFTKVESLRELHLALDGQGGFIAGGGRPPIEVARMVPKPGRSYHTLLRQSNGDIENRIGEPLIVQAPYGLGRVTVVGFDLDQKPFAGWEKQSRAWQWLLTKSWGRENPNVNPNDGNMNMRVWGGDVVNTELLAQMQNHLENFEEVPVISFFWVALFILVYIIVVGPLDYFFLKKVVKRLELTWITFPTVVLVVSAAAYFTAYWLKGSDLRIRKLDVVDIDLRAGQTVGHTWFTLFSPRIQHYTVGIEPAAPDWAPPIGEGAGSPSVLVSWMSRPEMNRFGGPSRSRGQSLFRRSYEYEGAATGLRGVPIQVWSTKSFEATWQAPLRNLQPLIATKLRHLPAKNGEAEGALSGEITWRPGAVEKESGRLRDAYLIYKGRAHSLPLVPGTPFRVDTLPLEFGGKPPSEWLRPAAPAPAQPAFNRGRFVATTNPTDIDNLVKTAWFFEAARSGNNGSSRNDGLRLMDQTWRAKDDNTEEVILVGRLEVRHGQAEAVTNASPTRLWLGALPSPDAKRPTLDGAMRQETFIRVFIPVQPK